MSVQLGDQSSPQGDVGGSVSQFSSRPTLLSAERRPWPQGGCFRTGKQVLRAVVPFWDQARSQTGFVCPSSSLRLCPTSMSPLRP